MTGRDDDASQGRHLVYPPATELDAAATAGHALDDARRRVQGCSRPTVYTMTRLSWDFTEGADPAPGDPGAYARLARDLGDSAEAAEAAYGHLQGLASGVDETIWSGSAADAFAGELAELPPQLEKLAHSSSLAAKAMATYGRVLEDLQHQAAGALTRAEQARAEEAERRRARDLALVGDPLAL